MPVQKIIDEIISKEGGYSNNSADPGGETMYGITLTVARANGYTGSMKDMPRQTAYDIYYKQYYLAPGFDRVAKCSDKVASELCDTGVNMGTGVACKMLQRSLNALTEGPLLVVDGDIGPTTLNTLMNFLGKRGGDGEAVLLKCLNILQGYRYIEIVEGRPASKQFIFGWIKNRVNL